MKCSFFSYAKSVISRGRCGARPILVDRHVVDESGLSDADGEKHAGRAVEHCHVFQGLGIAHSHVVDACLRVGLDPGSGRLDNSLGVGFPSGCHFPGSVQGLNQAQGCGSLVLGQIGVSGTHGKAVGFTERGAAQYLNGKVQIPDQAADDGQLLEIFFAENRHVGVREIEELGDHGGHPPEVNRPGLAAEVSGKRFKVNVGLESVRVDLLGGGGEYHCRAFVPALGEVPLEVSG